MDNGDIVIHTKVKENSSRAHGSQVQKAVHYHQIWNSQGNTKRWREMRNGGLLTREAQGTKKRLVSMSSVHSGVRQCQGFCVCKLLDLVRAASSSALFFPCSSPLCLPSPSVFLCNVRAPKPSLMRRLLYRRRRRRSGDCGCCCCHGEKGTKNWIRLTHRHAQDVGPWNSGTEF
jgi:hypothetical protein